MSARVFQVHVKIATYTYSSRSHLALTTRRVHGLISSLAHRPLEQYSDGNEHAHSPTMKKLNRDSAYHFRRLNKPHCRARWVSAMTLFDLACKDAKEWLDHVLLNSS